MTLSTMPPWLQAALQIWESGGWLMLPLFALSMVIYYSALDLWGRLRNHVLVREKIDLMSDFQMRQKYGEQLQGVSEQLQYCVKEADVLQVFSELRQSMLPPSRRRIRFLATLNAVAPLMGLLGTVSGILTTFENMVGVGASKMTGVIDGISEALITTQVGLTIALPAYILMALIVMQRKRLEHAILHLERYCLREVMKRDKAIIHRSMVS